MDCLDLSAYFDRTGLHAALAVLATLIAVAASIFMVQSLGLGLSCHQPHPPSSLIPPSPSSPSPSPPHNKKIEGESLVDAVYGAVVTLTTVGFGDKAPSPLTRLPTAVFVLLGVTAYASALGFAIRQMQTQMQMQPPKLLTQAMARLPAEPLRRSLVLLVLTLLLGAAVILLDGGARSLTDAIYFAAVVVTTIGYGDIFPQTSLGKVLTSLFIPLGTFVYGSAISALIDLPLSARKAALERQVLLNTSAQSALRETGAPRLLPGDFALHMLVKLGRITPADLAPIHQRFADLDPNNLGFLGSPTHDAEAFTAQQPNWTAVSYPDLGSEISKKSE